MLVSLITWGVIEGYGTLRASALMESLQKVGTPDVPAIVDQLSRYRRWADPQLVRKGEVITQSFPSLLAGYRAEPCLSLGCESQRDGNPG
jgi:hypothetical protein